MFSHEGRKCTGNVPRFTGRYFVSQSRIAYSRDLKLYLFSKNFFFVRYCRPHQHHKELFVIIVGIRHQATSTMKNLTTGMNLLFINIFALAVVVSSVNAFVIVPQPFLPRTTFTAKTTSVISAFPSNDLSHLSSFASSSYHQALSPYSSSSISSLFLIADDGSGSSGWIDIARNIGIGLTFIVFLLAGLTYLYASFIIPVAAAELEKECKELDPQLWESYQKKLGPGETMATRPDLMQELGAIIQPLVEEKLAKMEQDGLPTPLETTMNPFAGKDKVTTTTTTNSQPDEPTSNPTIATSTTQWDDDAESNVPKKS